MSKSSKRRKNGLQTRSRANNLIIRSIYESLISPLLGIYRVRRQIGLVSANPNGSLGSCDDSHIDSRSSCFCSGVLWLLLRRLEPRPTAYPQTRKRSRSLTFGGNNSRQQVIASEIRVSTNHERPAIRFDHSNLFHIVHLVCELLRTDEVDR